MEYSDHGTGDFRSPSFTVIDNCNGSSISPLRYVCTFVTRLLFNPIMKIIFFLCNVINKLMMKINVYLPLLSTVLWITLNYFSSRK